MHTGRRSVAEFIANRLSVIVDYVVMPHVIFIVFSTPYSHALAHAYERSA